VHYIGLFVASFCLVYVIYYVFIIARRKSLEKLKKSKSMDYFKQVYKIDPNKINVKEFANIFGVANAFIISIILTIVEVFDNFLLKLGVAALIMIPMIYIVYSFVGKHFAKDKNNLIDNKKKDVKKCTTSKK